MPDLGQINIIHLQMAINIDTARAERKVRRLAVAQPATSRMPRREEREARARRSGGAKGVRDGSREGIKVNERKK